MLVREGGEGDCITFTTVRDMAEVVARAVEHAGEWPVQGGVAGTTVSIRQLIALGEEMRGTYPPTSLCHCRFGTEGRRCKIQARHTQDRRLAERDVGELVGPASGTSEHCARESRIRIQDNGARIVAGDDGGHVCGG
jgi:nucleoside-diphosphate-sugar epimerase